MTNRVCSTLACRLALIGATTFAAADAWGQDRTPRFPFGISIPDNTGNNAIEWQGGDGPYGVYISPNYSFWGFSDTYVGPANSTTRSLSNYIGNSIAIGQTTNSINAGNFTPYYFNKGTYQSPGAFFPNPANGYKYWPRKAIMINGKLYVFLYVQYYPGDGTSQYLGSFVARVNNPTAIPTNWQVDTFALFTSAVNQYCPLTFGMEAQVFSTDNNNLYAYCLYFPKGASVPTSVVITLDLNALASTANGGYFSQQNAQYLAAYDGINPTFGPGYGIPASGQQANYFDTGINPYYYSLRYNATAKKWQLVACLGLSAGPAVAPQGSGADANSRQSAYVFMSPTPFGPFNGPKATAAQLPAFAEFNSGYDTSVNQNYKYVYTAREWVDPSLTNDYQIAMTYTYSSANLPDTVNDNRTYITGFASVTNPLLPPPANNSAASVHAARVGPAALAALATQGDRAPVAWEDTPAAATMPKPRPVPVSGFSPVEQRNPWEISAETKRDELVVPRAKAKLKVR